MLFVSIFSKISQYFPSLPKPEILTSLPLRQMDDNSNGKSGVFDHAHRQETDPGRLRQRPTTGNGNIDVLLANHAKFRVVDRCRNHLANLLSRWATGHHRKSWIWRWNFDAILSEFHGCNYFRF